MKKPPFAAAIFDLDGVITKTARVHFAAWKQMFDAFLAKHAAQDNRPFHPFSEEEYLAYVDGKPRFKGVESFLAARAIALPFGESNDDGSGESVCGLGNRKNQLFQSIIENEGAELFPHVVDFLQALRKTGVKIGLATSSKNGRLILEKADITKYFDAVVDGVVSAEIGLAGKPEPDIFLKTAELLGVHPHESLLFEDALAGVAAGKRGNFGLVVGVSHGHESEALRAAGADMIVSDLGELPLQSIDDWFASGIEADSWRLTYHGFDPQAEKLREVLTTVGNGYFGTRGASESESAGEHHYPGTYMTGVYNKLPSEVHGMTIVNNDLVNCPNWLPIEFRIGDGDYKSPLGMSLHGYTHTIDIKNAIMERHFICEDECGRLTKIISRRFASMADPHAAALRFELTPLNYSAQVTLRSSLDGSVINTGVDRYKALNSKHLETITTQAKQNRISLAVRTLTSGVTIAMHAEHRLLCEGKPLPTESHHEIEAGTVGATFTCDAVEGQSITIEKIVTLANSLDTAADDPLSFVQTHLAAGTTFDKLQTEHQAAWQTLWEQADIRIEGDRFVQKALRLHIYHLLVTASAHNKHLDAGMPARGLHGEAYRGHIFWDELYVFPFYNMYFPEITKALLMYRYHRLDAARAYAEENGYSGAMYPQQTADDGAEESQVIHYNPLSGKWDPDLSRRQRHVSIAVFYNVWTYVNHTDDRDFLEKFGAEMLIEIARFWASIATFDKKSGRYHIAGVMGPDEYHEKLPDSDEPGITDNAYTNIMVVWLLEKILDILPQLPDAVRDALFQKLKFDEHETEKWHDMIAKMHVIITADNVLSQFEGYMDLPELDWDKYRNKYPNIQRMDRILKSENDSPDHYKVAKQADVLMLYYLLAPQKVVDILTDLGYKVPDAQTFLQKNYAYYITRTSHGSTLSKIVHATIAHNLTTDGETWQWFMDALRSDIEDTQGGTTLEGIHTGVMAGTVEIAIRNFGGVAFEHDRLVIAPNLPHHWHRMTFCVWHHDIRYHLELTPKTITVVATPKRPTDTKSVQIEVFGKLCKLSFGTKKTFRATTNTC